VTGFNEGDLPARMSSAQSRELGAELRQIRRAAGYRANKLAKELGWSQAKVSKLERGWRGTSAWDIAALLGRCSTDKPTRDRILNLVQEAQLGYYLRPHHSYADGLLSLNIHESAAATLLCYEPMRIPALIQARSYASSLLNPIFSSLEQVELMVQNRMDRQSNLQKNEDATSVFYIHEVALNLQVGNIATMHGQMKWLAFLCDLERIQPRVIPLATGGHSALCSSATLLTFDKGTAPLSYTETDVTTAFVDDEGAIDRYRWKFAVLDELALDVRQSRAIFEQRADFYDPVIRC